MKGSRSLPRVARRDTSDTATFGSPAPSGVYHMSLEMDKLQGNGDVYPDFETWTSPSITVIRESEVP